MKIPKPSFSTVLISTLGFACLVAIAFFALLASNRTKDAAEPLQGGQVRFDASLILSWEVDTETMVFRARVHNETNKLAIVRMNPDTLEARIRVTSKDGSNILEFAQKDYYRMLLIAFWIPPELKIAANSAHDWAVPFAELEHMEYASQQTFADAIKNSKIEIISVHGANYRYDDQGRFDGFK